MYPLSLNALQTPCLLLDKAKMQSNIDKMQAHSEAIGCALRPHVKTAKSLDVAAYIFSSQDNAKICVSTLREAEYFAEAGYKDIMYAVGIAPDKLDIVASLQRQNVNISIVLDNAESARAVRSYGEQAGLTFSVYIELDVDGHRSGIDPEDGTLVEIAEILSTGPGARLEGVMTHAGESYNAGTTAEIETRADLERYRSVRAAEKIQDAGFSCPRVSVGSTPTATFLKKTSGLSEIRAGVYVFQDLFQAGLGVCDIDDIAISVFATVIGHQRSKNWVIVDAGWMAMSRDRGTASQKQDQGYGLVCDQNGAPFPEDLIVVSANQEHGIIALRDGGPIDLSAFPVGTKLRLLPNHACSTAAQYDCYHVVEQGECTGVWPRIRGW